MRYILTTQASDLSVFLDFAAKSNPSTGGESHRHPSLVFIHFAAKSSIRVSAVRRTHLIASPLSFLPSRTSRVQVVQVCLVCCFSYSSYLKPDFTLLAHTPSSLARSLHPAEIGVGHRAIYPLVHNSVVPDKFLKPGAGVEPAYRSDDGQSDRATEQQRVSAVVSPVNLSLENILY